MTTWIAFAAGYLLCFVTLVFVCLWTVKLTLRLTGQPDRLWRYVRPIAPQAGKTLVDPVDDTLPVPSNGPPVQRFAGKPASTHSSTASRSGR